MTPLVSIKRLSVTTRSSCHHSNTFHANRTNTATAIYHSNDCTNHKSATLPTSNDNTNTTIRIPTVCNSATNNTAQCRRTRITRRSTDGCSKTSLCRPIIPTPPAHRYTHEVPPVYGTSHGHTVQEAPR